MCDFMLLDSVTTHEADKNMKQAKLLSDLDFKRLTAIIDSLRYSTRNHTAVALSFYAGLRACEIAALRVGDVFDANGKPKDTIYLSAAQTKGSESCTVLANKRLRHHLYPCRPIPFNVALSDSQRRMPCQHLHIPE